MSNTNFAIPAGLSLRNDQTSVACDDCGHWEHLERHSKIRHAKRCETRGLQVTWASQAQASAPAKTASVTVVTYPTCGDVAGAAPDWSRIERGSAAEQRAFEDLAANPQDWGRAMNSDF